MKALAAISAIGALAVSTHALAGDPQPDPSLSIHLGTFVNVGWGAVEYEGNFADRISVTAAPQNGSMFPTSIAIDLSSILINAGYNAFTDVTVRDTGLNLYSSSSPGADVDWLAFEGLHQDLTVSFSYDGPVGVHQGESSQQLAVRVAELDALSGHTHESDVRHVSLGMEGELTAHVSGWAGGGDGGGPDIGDLRGGDPVRLMLSEAGMGESFDVFVTPSTVPAPGVLGLLGLAGAMSRRRRRRA